MDKLIVAKIKPLSAYQAWADIWMRAGWRVQQNVVSGDMRLLDADARRVFTSDPLHDARRLAPFCYKTQAIVMLHGMGRSHRSFARLAGRLSQEEYAVANIGYASLLESTSASLMRIKTVLATLEEGGAHDVSFIGHSLGGLLIRKLCAEKLPLELKHAIFLGTPNQGAYIAERLASFRLYGTIFGLAGREIATGALNDLPIPDTDIAVIAGGTGHNGYNRFLPGDNDGLVQVAETRLDRGEAFLRLKLPHTLLPSHKTIGDAVTTYLRKGSFA